MHVLTYTIRFSITSITILAQTFVTSIKIDAFSINITVKAANFTLINILKLSIKDHIQTLCEQIKNGLKIDKDLLLRGPLFLLD